MLLVVSCIEYDIARGANGESLKLVLRGRNDWLSPQLELLHFVFSAACLITRPVNRREGCYRSQVAI